VNTSYNICIVYRADADLSLPRLVNTTLAVKQEGEQETVCFAERTSYNVVALPDLPPELIPTPHASAVRSCDLGTPCVDPTLSAFRSK
jgi:hypothetical protein